MKIKSSVITSMYNGNSSTIEVIDKLFFPSLIRNASKDLELIILDDASPMEKGTRELVDKYTPELEKKFGRFIFERNPVNLGFAGSFNRGINIAKGKKLFIVNDDIYLPIGSVSALLSTLDENKNYGVVGPIVNEKDTWSYQYYKQAPKISSYSEEEMKKIEDFAILVRKIIKGKRVEVDFVSGFCFAIDASIMREYGEFDNSFKNGSFEDVDLIWRIRKKYSIVVNPEVFVYHGGIHGGHVSLNQNRIKRHYNDVKNILELYRKTSFPSIVKFFLMGMYRSTGRGTVSSLFEKELRNKSYYKLHP